MHEIRVTAPTGRSTEVAQVALAVGIHRVTVQKVYVHGPNQDMEVVSTETSTPCAKAFIDALCSATWFDPAQYSLTAREPPGYSHARALFCDHASHGGTGFGRP
jgi:hypothetical protein